MALAAAFDHLADRRDLPAAHVIGKALDDATGRYLLERKAPSRTCGEPDNRASHYWVARFWAEALAGQSDDAALASRVAPLATALAEQEETILAELLAVQGSPVDVGGHFQPDPERAAAAMRPSATLNAILDGALAGTA